MKAILQRKAWLIAALIWAVVIAYLSFSCTPDEINPSPTRRTVQEGKSDFVPNHSALPGEARSFDGIARIHASCWYDVLGVDNADYNKLAGVYRYIDGVKDKNSFILAWRPHIAIRNRFELCLYENIAGANVPHDSATNYVNGGELFTFRLEELNGKYKLYVNETLLGEQRNNIRYTVIGKVSAWFGGNRKAPWTMWLEMDF